MQITDCIRHILLTKLQSKSYPVNTHLLFIKIGKQMDRCRIQIVCITNNKNCAVIMINNEVCVFKDEEVTTKD